MSATTYDFQEGQLVELFHGVPADAWDIYTVPDDVLRAALSWNDANGDFDNTPRVHLLEIFLADFIVSKNEPAAKNDYVTKIETVNTGGGCMVDFAHLWDGRVITLNDECLGVFKSAEDFWDDDNGHKAELWHLFSKGE